jgi:hypothetical protein
MAFARRMTYSMNCYVLDLCRHFLINCFELVAEFLVAPRQGMGAFTNEHIDRPPLIIRRQFNACACHWHVIYEKLE